MPFRTKKTRVWQYDIVVNGSRLRGSCGTTDREEAKVVEARVRSDHKRVTTPHGSFTLSEALGCYYRDVSDAQPSAQTTRSQAKGLIEQLGGRVRIDRLTNADILAFTARRRAKVSNATVNRQLQLLGRALRHMKRFYSASVPNLELRAAEAAEPKERVRELSAVEQGQLFVHLPSDIAPVVTFALMTGARISTICNLQWRDVDLERGEMIFHLKGDERMTFPISRDLRAILSSLPVSNVLADRRYVFTRLNKATMERCRIVPGGGVFNAEFRAALKAAGIDDFRVHDLRHTFATRMLRRTGNLKLVGRLLGHKSIEATMRYAHVMVDDMRSALDEFNPAGAASAAVTSARKS